MDNTVTVHQDDVSISNNTAVLIDQVLDAEVVTVDPVIQIDTEQYVLSSGGMYGSNGLIGAIPQWILDAVQQQLTTGDGNLTSVVMDMQTLLDSLQLGVSQTIASLNTLAESTSSITTGLQSQVDNNQAAILQMVATKVTATEAQAIAATAIDSTFDGNVDAYIGSIASTYVDANSAIAQEVDLLQSSIGDVSASVTDISSATVEYVLNPDWIDDGNQTDPDINGEPRYILQAKAKKQLIVDANGVVSGIILESGETSSVTILGDEFKLVATGQNVASRNPFTVNATTGEISFVGVVDFTNTNNSGTTTIDGDHITTGTITTNLLNVNEIKAGDIFVNNSLISSNFNGNRTGNIGNPTTGFRLSANAAGTFSDPTIYGAYIRGGTISADSIVSGSLTRSNVLSSSVTVGSATKTLLSDLYDNTGGTSTLIVLNIWIANFADTLKAVRLYRNGVQIFQTEANMPSRVSLSFVDNAGYNTYTITMDRYGTGSNVVNTLASFIYFKK